MSNLAQLEQRHVRPLLKTKPWKHQREAACFCIEQQPEAAMLAMGMGCGKSLSVLYTVALEQHRTVLILCPKSVLGVWRREIERHFAGEHTVLVLDKGTTKTKADQLRRVRPHGVLFVVVNYDTAWREPLANDLIAFRFDCVIADESHRLKAPGGKSSRWAGMLGRSVGRRVCLTGTPMPHSPLDLYGQFRFLAPQVFGTSFTRFRARYALTHKDFPSKVMQWLNQDELQVKFHQQSFVCTADDVLDLPELTHNVRTCTLSAKSARVYRELEKDFVAQVEAGTVTIANALTKLLRLQQVTSGFVGGEGDDGERFVEQLGDDKAQLLSDLLSDTDEPAVVFCRFRGDLDAVERVASNLGRSYAELSGRRRDAIDEHANMVDVQIAGVQIASGGVGIDLTRAALGIYYSLGFSLGDYLQSIARLHRPGQLRPTRLFHLVAEGTVDEAVYRALEKREEVVTSIMQEIGASNE